MGPILSRRTIRNRKNQSAGMKQPHGLNLNAKIDVIMMIGNMFWEFRLRPWRTSNDRIHEKSLQSAPWQQNWMPQS